MKKVLSDIYYFIKLELLPLILTVLIGLAGILGCLILLVGIIIVVPVLAISFSLVILSIGVASLVSFGKISLNFLELKNYFESKKETTNE